MIKNLFKRKPPQPIKEVIPLIDQATSIITKFQKDKSYMPIPPKKNRIIQRKYDEEIYKERHKIECLFGFLKHYRR